MASSRRTYDTDSITLRTVFAKNPGNTNVPALRALTADGQGGTFWAVPSSLGANPSFNEIITSAATYTADLSYNKFRLFAGENIGMVDGSAGSNQTTLFGKSFSRFDISGGNTIAAFSNNQLDSSVKFVGENGVMVRADPVNHTFFIGGTGASNTTISTGIYGFSQIKVTPAASSITSSLVNWDGSFLTANSPSSLLRFVGYNDIQLSTNVTTNSVFFTISTFTSEGYLNLSTAAYSAYPNAISTVSSLYVPNNVFVSSINSLSTVSGVQWSSVQSSITALAISTGEQFYILTGLINARATIDQLNVEIASVNSNIVSTVGGLGSAGYLSTGGGGSGDVTQANLVSTVIGLGTVGYISSGGGGSGDVTKANLISTVMGLGTVDYVSTASLFSTFSTFSTALGQIGTGNLTAANLVSTTAGLQQSGFISTPNLLNLVSTQNLANLVSTNNLAGLVSTQNLVDLVSTNNLAGLISTQNLANLVSTNNLAGLVSTQNLVDLVSTNNLAGLVSTQNLADLVSTNNLLSLVSSPSLISTVRGLGSAGYLSSFNSLSMSTGNIKTANLEVSTVNFVDTGNGLLRELNSSNNALYFNGSLVGSGSVINNFITSTFVFQVSSVSTIFAYNSVVVSSATNVFLSPQYFSSIFFSSGAVQTSSIQFIDTQTNAIQLLAVNNGQLQINGNAITVNLTDVVSTANLANLVSTNNLRGLVSTQNLANLVSTSYLTSQITSTTVGLGSIGYVSSAALSGLVSTQNLQNLVSTQNLSGHVSTANLANLVSTNYLTSQITSTTVGLGTIGYVSSAALAGLVSTQNLANLVSTSYLTSQITSTTVGLGTIGYVSTAGLRGLVSTQNLAALVSTNNLLGLVSTQNLANLVSTNNLAGLVSTQNLANLVSTNNLAGLVSTQNLANLVSTQNLANLVSTQNLANLVSTNNLIGLVSTNNLLNLVSTTALTYQLNSTVGGLGQIYISTGGGGGGITTANLTSTVGGLGQIYISTGGGGGGITTANLTSTVQGLGSSEYISSYKVRVLASTLGDEDFSLFTQDIGKYFLFTQNNASRILNLPSLLDGWNATVKNMAASSNAFTISTTISSTVLAPGVATTVLCDGTNFYAL